MRRAVVQPRLAEPAGRALEEHRAAALWGGETAASAWSTRYGEVFDANLGDVEDEALPMLSGPDGAAARMLAMHARLVPLFGQAFDSTRASRR